LRSHGVLLDGVTVDEDLKAKLSGDYAAAGLSETNQLIIEFAAKTTNEAYSVDKSYIDNLRSHGFTDDMVHDVVQVTAYFNYINRLADALGVELEG
jgi:uncharacterized peroxidase-related enzyme